MVSRSEVRKDLYGSRMREMRLTVAHPEVRENTDGTFRICGYASTTGAPYAVTDWLGEYTETIDVRAFNKTLQEADDVKLLVNHEGIPLARTKSGTLTLRAIMKPEDDPQGKGQTGLWSDAPNLDGASPLAQTIRSAIGREDVDQMSFAFQATRQEWNKDYTERTVLECKLFDVSVVTYPANPATSVHLNSEKIATIAQRMQNTRALTDPDDVAELTKLLGVLSAISDVVEGAEGETEEYLGITSPASPMSAPEVDAETEPGDMPMRADDVDLEARAQALALAKARARK